MDSTTFTRISAALKQQRQQRGLSRLEAARQIGISDQTVFRIEERSRTETITLGTVVSILDWLGLQLAIEPKPRAER